VSGRIDGLKVQSQIVRHELTIVGCGTHIPLLPNELRGVPHVDGRRLLDGIFRISP